MGHASQFTCRAQLPQVFSYLLCSIAPLMCRLDDETYKVCLSQAVSASLAETLSQQRQRSQCGEAAAAPLLFALCSAGQQQGGATCSFQYRFFQHSQVPRQRPSPSMLSA